MSEVNVGKMLSGVGADPSQGIRSTCLAYPVGPWLPEACRGSVRLALKATEKLGWPGLASYKGWKTKKYGDSVWCEDMQGMAFGAGHWYVSQTGSIRKCADKTGDYPRIGKHVLSGKIPPTMAGSGFLRYNHFGDVDFVSAGIAEKILPAAFGQGGGQGVVLAPLEGDKPKSFPYPPEDFPVGVALVLAYSASTLAPLPLASSPLYNPPIGEDGALDTSQGVLEPQRSCSWCAVNPWDGMLLTSKYHPPYSSKLDRSFLYVYDPTSSRQVTLSDCNARYPTLSEEAFDFLAGPGKTTLAAFNMVGVFPVEGKISHVQGGAISDDGVLYLAVDPDDGHGIYRYSMLTGRLLDVIGVDRSGLQELEGVCLYGPAAGCTSLGEARVAYGGISNPSFLCTAVWGRVAFAKDNVYFKRLPLAKYVKGRPDWQP